MTTRVNIKNSVWAQFLRPVANFNIRLFTMAIVIVLVVVSCGKDDKDDDDKGGDDTEMTAANWQKVIKDVYGFDLTVPTGWTFRQGEQTNINPAYYVQFTTTAANFQTEYEKLLQHVFDLTEKVTPSKGNYNDADVKFDAVPGLEMWNFDTSKYAIQISFQDAEASKIAQIVLVALKSL